IAWLSQSFLQLVLLPIIIVGQNVISASQDARAEADHITLTTLHAINVQQLKMLEQQQAMLKQQREILDLLQARGITMSTDEPGACRPRTWCVTEGNARNPATRVEKDADSRLRD